MIIIFKDKRTKAYFEDVRKLQKEHGKDVAQNTTKRIQSLESADDLLEFHENNPFANTHFLHGNRENEVSISVNSAKRLIAIPVDLDEKEVNIKDFKKITALRILKIEDYHG